MKPRFSITVTNYGWSCGDGCCSDSGYKLVVWDNAGPSLLLDDPEWEYNRDQAKRITEGVEAIAEVLGHTPVLYVDYIVYEDNESSGSPDEEN